MRLIYPLVWFFGHFTSWVHHLTGGKGDPTVTESELIGMLGYGVEEGAIEHNERKIIERVFAFNDLKVRDVMTPKGKIFSLDEMLTVAEALPVVSQERYSRIPLFEGQNDNYKKVLYLRDLLRASASGQLEERLANIGHEPLFVSQYQAIDDLFATFRRRNRVFSIMSWMSTVMCGVSSHWKTCSRNWSAKSTMKVTLRHSMSIVFPGMKLSCKVLPSCAW